MSRKGQGIFANCKGAELLEKLGKAIQPAEKVAKTTSPEPSRAPPTIEDELRAAGSKRFPDMVLLSRSGRRAGWMPCRATSRASPCGRRAS